MKKLVLLAIAIILGMAQTMAQEDYNKAQRPPQQKEVVLGRNIQTRGGHDSYQYAYNAALREAKQNYPSKNVGIRNLTKGDLKINSDGSVSYYYNYTIVELPDAAMQKVYEAINKATREIYDGSRFALDRISVYDEQFQREVVKSNIIDYLIGRGYKVVAKEKLEKLYREQQDQQSGIYNPNTTVKGNNFSAVGYFISVTIDYSYVQVQVVNVSTGEFEGNVTVNL